MKKLTKISLDGFDELSIHESAQLFGGQNTTPSDSTSTTKPKVTNTVTVNSSYNQKTGYNINGTYSWSNGPVTISAGVGYNQATGYSGSTTIGIKW